MKKALSLILALVMALSLAACGGGKTETPSDSNTPADNTSAEPTKLSLILRGGTYADVIKECLPAFEAEHNVVCEVQELSEGDLYSGIALDAINDKGSYDLCMVDGSWMAEFTENGVLANLSEMGYSFDDDIIPATTTICKVGEDIYLAPYYGNVTVMMYNKELLSEAGYAPEDIDSFADLMDIAQKTKDAHPDKNGFLVRGGSADNTIDISGFTNPRTKNNHDLAAYAIQAWEHGWGYVWGTFGTVLTESMLQYKLEQYPDIGASEAFIREHWLGRRTTDCVGLLKGYGWLNPDTLTIDYNTNGMPDYTADQMYASAKENGTEYGGMDTMPDIVGLGLWKQGHWGVYVGNGYAIEAMGTQYGVVRTKVEGRGWQGWCKIPYIQYDE